jgi:hypothetical protein
MVLRCLPLGLILVEGDGGEYSSSSVASCTPSMGLVVYGLDGVPLLVAGDLLSLGFHCIVLFAIHDGLAAVNVLSHLNPASPGSAPAQLSSV